MNSGAREQSFYFAGAATEQSRGAPLADNWRLVQIGEVKPTKFEQWEICFKEYRESLQWAMILPGERETSPAVVELLAELARRGVAIFSQEGSQSRSG